MKNKIRKISEKTILTSLVNYKFVVFFGRCFKSLTKEERTFVIDDLQRRGYIDINMNILPAAKEIILKNLNLLQY